MCLYFCRFGECGRQQKGECGLLHDPSKVAVCTHWLAGGCSAGGKCKRQHKVTGHVLSGARVRGTLRAVLLCVLPRPDSGQAAPPSCLVVPRAVVCYGVLAAVLLLLLCRWCLS